MGASLWNITNIVRNKVLDCFGFFDFACRVIVVNIDWKGPTGVWLCVFGKPTITTRDRIFVGLFRSVFFA